MVMIDQQATYRRFLDAATRVLVAGGAQLLLGPDPVPGQIPADWTHGWDQILASNQPGSRAIFAFADGDKIPAEDLRARVSRLADGVVQAGFIRGTPLKLIAVVVFPAGLRGRSSRSVTGLSPRTFHQGLRPSTWAIDVPAGKVLTPGFLKPQEARELERALTATEGEVLDPSGISVLEQEHSRRNLAFYTLMRSRQPYVTYALIAINVAIFILMRPNPAGNIDINTLRDFGALSANLVGQGQWWRMFTSIFLHASIAHILFNMLSLFAIGTLAERLYGSSKFLVIYLGAGLIGSIASVLYAIASGHPDELGVGASGAIFGVAGALLTLRFQRSDIIPLRLRTQISMSLLPLVAFSLIFSFLTPYVDNSAHIGGLLGGAALSFLFPLIKTLPQEGVRAG